MTKSITRKLIVVLTLCLGAVLAAGMSVDYQLSRNEILERVRAESEVNVNSVVGELEQWLRGVEGDTLFLARVLEQREYSREGLNQLLKDIVAHNNEIFGAAIALNPALTDKLQGYSPYFYHRDGATTYANLGRQESPYWEKSWYSDAVTSGKPVWVEPYFDETGGQVLMTTFSVPVYHVGSEGNRSLYAVVTADVALAELHRYLQNLQLGKYGYGLLLSKSGTVLSSDRADSIMHHYLDAVSTGDDKEIWERSFKAALKGETLTFPIECPAILGQCNARLSTLKTTGWPVGLIYSQKEVLAPLKEYELKMAFVGLATLLLMALTVGIVSRRLTKPLVALAKASDIIATGDLAAPLPRVRGDDEVALLVHSFAAMKRDLKAYIEDLKIATAGTARLEGEMAAAAQIQMSMLPQGGEALTQTVAYSLWATVRPAKSVGGDLFNYYLREKNKLYFAVGDVSDKGVSAALFMAKTMSHMQQFEDAFNSPSAGMALLNNALEKGNDNCMFVTLFFGVLDLKTYELHFANAGHTAPSLLRNSVVTTLPQETGPVLGLAENISFPANSFQLRPGDRLAIFTDGIDEAFNDKAEMFSIEGLNQQLEKSGAQSIAPAGKAIIQAVDNFAGPTAQSDDITLMLIDLALTGSTIPGTRNSRRSFENKPSTPGLATEWIKQWLQLQAIGEHTYRELMLVTEEITANIVNHAQLSLQATIDVTIETDNEQVTLEFSDPGIAFNPFADAHRATLGADIESAEMGGLGVHLIAALTDWQGYNRINGQNVVTVKKFHIDKKRQTAP